jgi:hypothetical protein
MNTKTVVELLSLYLQQTYKAQLVTVSTKESSLGYDYKIITFWYRNEEFEVKVYGPDFILIRKYDLPGTVSDNLIDARKEIDSVLKQY